MVFTVNVGNTVTTYGVAFSADDIRFRRTATVETKTDLELMLMFLSFLDEQGLKADAFSGSVLSCVVPPQKSVLIRALRRLTGSEPLIVDASCACGFTIGLPERNELGANLIALSSAVVRDYGVPAILINVGTATSFGVIDKDAVYRGGVLYPGMQNALDALVSRTSLPPMDVDGNAHLTGRNTYDSIQAGVLYGHAGAVDRILDELLEEVPGASIVIAGKRGRALKGVIRHEAVFDDAILLRGLYYIAEAKGGKS
ncbi:MAG: type III pantothenate kinase [Lachnospiraceae bacterium]|nr:type III pantothenate kinase [Lachnospiraceae bacterium]